MKSTLTAVSAEQTNRRFAGTPHRVLWSRPDLECHVSAHGRGALTTTELLEAVDRLVDAKCVRPPTSVDESADGLAFRWNTVGALTYGWEWPAEGWRAAAVTSLRALEILRPRKLTLRALQHGDLFMAGSQPMVANLGAVTSWSEQTEANCVEQIHRQFVRPFECALAGRGRVARRLLRADASGLSVEDAALLTGSDSRAPRTLADMLRWIERATLPNQLAPKTTGNYEERMVRGYADEIAAKSNAVLNAVSRVNPASVLDLGCNTGLFSQLTASARATVTGVDSNEDYLNIYFTRAAGWPNPASAVLMDLADPSPARGWADGWCSSAEQRLSSELVLALALIHHLVLGARMRPEQLRHCFQSFAQRWLLLEFIPIGPENFYADGPEYYTLDWVIGTLGEAFVLRHSWPHGERGRCLLLLERRGD